jgi:hypothetical protein
MLLTITNQLSRSTCCGDYESQLNEASWQDDLKYCFAYDTKREQANLFGEQPKLSTPLLAAGVLAQQQTHGSERKYDDA